MHSANYGPTTRTDQGGVLSGKAPGFVIHKNGTVRFQNRVCVPIVGKLKKKILDEGHNSPHSVLPGGEKLYKNLKQTFWCSNMKQKLTDYVPKCLTHQHMKMKYQGPAGLLQPLEIPEYNWNSISVDFMVRLPLTQKKNNALWVIVDRFTK